MADQTETFERARAADVWGDYLTSWDHECHNAAFDRGECSGGTACLHRRCFEPRHLAAATTAQNSARGGHPLYVVARQQMCRKGLHDLTDPANRKTRKDGRSRCRPCDNEGARRRWATK